jgi:hypothetical protein
MPRVLSEDGALTRRCLPIRRVIVPPIQRVVAPLGAVTLVRCAMVVLAELGVVLTRQMRATLTLVVHRAKPARVVLVPDRFKGVVLECLEGSILFYGEGVCCALPFGRDS